MALDIRGKTALVTGGASGICLELTRQLVAGGCNVVIADLALRPEASDITNAKNDARARASFIETDVLKWDQLQRCFDFAIKEFGHLDIVVPGAGIFDPPVCLFLAHAGSELLLNYLAGCFQFLVYQSRGRYCAIFFFQST